MASLVIVITASLVILMLATNVMYRTYLNTKLEYIDNMIKRGFDTKDVLE